MHQSLFFIHSPNTYHYQKYFKKKTIDLNPIYIYSFNMISHSLSEVLDEATTMTLGANEKVITLYHYDKVSNKKEFIDFLEALPPTCTCFFLKNTPKTPEKVSKFIKKSDVSKIVEINVYEEKLDQIKRQIIEHLKELHISFDLRVVETYALLFEGQSDLLKQELEKLYLFLKSKKETKLNMNNLKELLSVSQQHNIFKVGRTILMRNRKNSTLLFKQFLGQSPENFIPLVAYLLSELNKIYIYKELIKNKTSPKEAFKKMKLNYPKSQETLLKIERYFTLNEILNMTEHLYDVDKLLKTSSFANGDIDKSSINQKAYQLFLKIILFFSKE